MQARLRRIGHETNWVNIAASGSHNLAVKSDGSLWAWGGNYSYQLGDGTMLSRNTPMRCSAPRKAAPSTRVFSGNR